MKPWLVVSSLVAFSCDRSPRTASRNADESTIAWVALADQPWATRGRLIRLCGELSYSYEDASVCPVTKSRSSRRFETMPAQTCLALAPLKQTGAEEKFRSMSGKTVILEGQVEWAVSGHMGSDPGRVINARVLREATCTPVDSGRAPPPEAHAATASGRVGVIDKTRVRVSEYDACVRSEACPARRLSNFDDSSQGCAVNGGAAADCVSFVGAAAYCEWAGKRLPTATEWSAHAYTFDVESLGDGGGPTDQGPSSELKEWTASPFCEAISGADCFTFARVLIARSPGENPDIHRSSGLTGWPARPHESAFRCFRGMNR